MDKGLGKFYVNFYYGCFDELDEILESNPEGEEEYIESHTYHNEIALTCSEKEYCDFIYGHDDDIRAIEDKYGVLDGEGMDDDMGYSSYEISLEDAPKAWAELVKLLANANLVKGE